MGENKGNKGRKTSFWKLLEGHRVEVPIIQRDYAQGRVGKEFLRTKFLEDLKDALDKKRELVLDFVYGSQKGELIRPLDGQQRLTTLWLLHWYIALRAGELKENCEVLKKFTYETRISSREFCENLCDPQKFESFGGKKIVDFIENQTWFSSAWKQDPTIQAMLRMLGGTETNDSIEKLFKKTDYGKYWDKIRGSLGSKRELKVSGVGQKARKLLKPLKDWQRQVALWLLFWYSACKSKKLDTKASDDPQESYTVKDVLKELIPQTNTPKEICVLCENLCDPKFESFKDQKIVDFIKVQTWFSSAWEKDQEIQTTLQILGGTETDSIEKLFKDANHVEYWNKIKGNLYSKRELKVSGVGRKARKLLLSLDSRQRPLSLWLLFWYGAYKSKKLNAKASATPKESYTVKDVLKELIPEPERTPLLEFCENLVCLKKEDQKDPSMVEHIKKQEWFPDTWEQDPTIKFMLQLLGVAETKGTEEKLFKDANYAKRWDKDKDKIKGCLSSEGGNCADENLKQVFDPLKDWQRQVDSWLLSWYDAYKSKSKVSKDLKDILKKKRPTPLSRFCESLVSFEKEQQDGVGIVEHIKEQMTTWFSSAWKEDPTIQSALQLLGGTESSDGIEDAFDGVDYKNFWEELTSEEAPPIAFYYLPLENFGLSDDDLYVKMNARGKPLTPFENFKADLIGYLSKRAAKDKNWKSLYEDIPAKLDNTWTDIFWDKGSSKNKIDEIYFAFLNRFFWNELFVATKEAVEFPPKIPPKNKEDYILRFSKGSKLESPNSSFEYLDKDSIDEYLGLEHYKFFNGEIPIWVFEDLEKVLDNYWKYKEHNGEIPLLYGFTDFKFIPEYNENNDTDSKKIITEISNRAQRVIFFAICEYFKSDEAKKALDNTSLRRLMRVVCNLVSGKDTYGTYYVREYPGVRDAIEYIGSLEVSKYPHDVYERLANKRLEPTSEKKKDLSSLDSQWNEEIIKARQILDDDGENLRYYDAKTEKTWEEVIRDAEEYAFFDGAIRFLYQDDKELKIIMEGDKWKGRGIRRVKLNWDNFGAKFDYVVNHFEKVRDAHCCLRAPYNNAKLLKRLISWFTDDNILKGDKRFRFNNEVNTWRYYLLNTNIYEPVNKLLCGKPKERPSQGDQGRRIVYLLSSTGLLNFMSNPWLKWLDKGRGFAMYELNSNDDSRKYVLLNTNKYGFLSECEVIEENPKILPDKNPSEALHYERSDIYFKYEKRWYLRRGPYNEQGGAADGWIYLLDPNSTEAPDPNSTEDKRAIVVDPEKANSKNEHEKYYCFDPEGRSTKEILEGLEARAKLWEGSKNHRPPEKEEGEHGAKR